MPHTKYIDDIIHNIIDIHIYIYEDMPQPPVSRPPQVDKSLRVNERKGHATILYPLSYILYSYNMLVCVLDIRTQQRGTIYVHVFMS